VAGRTRSPDPVITRTTDGPQKKGRTRTGRPKGRDWELEVRAGSRNSSGVSAFIIRINDIQDKKPGDKKKSAAFRKALRAAGHISKKMDAGHAVGRQLAEGEELYNVFDERSNFNRGDKRTEEGRIRAKIDANPGGRMRLEIMTTFKDQPGNPEVAATILRLVDMNTGHVMHSATVR
jgi:hypothetical protein